MVAERDILRKGKWTAEEEEYTTQIIEYFNEGLVPLPEGTTLRAYLADKLNCDPMRITKKFTGSACLGKRIYHRASARSASPAPELAARAHTHLRQLEARFLNRMERSKDKDFCGIVELDPTFYNHPNIISTPAIDALIQQSRLDPNFWEENSTVEEDEEEHEEEEAALFFGPPPTPHEASISMGINTATAGRGGSQHQEGKAETAAAEEEQQPQQSSVLQPQRHQHQQQLLLPGLESGLPAVEQPVVGGSLSSAFPSMTSVSAMLLEPFAGAGKRGKALLDLDELRERVAGAGDGHTDGSESGFGSDSEAESSAHVVVGSKRRRRDAEEGPERPPRLQHFSSSASTSSTLSARTSSGGSSWYGDEAEGETEAEASDASARQMLDVVSTLRKRASHEDLVSFVCEVNQKQQQPQPQQPHSIAGMVVHCI